jgi:hypothetical protein
MHISKHSMDHRQIAVPVAVAVISSSLVTILAQLLLHSLSQPPAPARLRETAIAHDLEEEITIDRPVTTTTASTTWTATAWADDQASGSCPLERSKGIGPAVSICLQALGECSEAVGEATPEVSGFLKGALAAPGIALIAKLCEFFRTWFASPLAPRRVKRQRARILSEQHEQ